MAYATATMSSYTPAKDLMAALNTQLVAGGMTFVETFGTPTNATWQSVTYGGGLFVAIASATATVATSPDGITWTQRILPVATTWTSVTYGGGLFVAVASSSTIAASSPDGITWTMRSLPIAATWTSVTYGNSLFVAVSTGGSTIAASSPDGVTWTQRTLPTSVSWSSVTYGNGVFVAVATGGTTAASSPDGVTWTARTLSASATWQSVVYGGSLFVAVATGGTTAASSPDGITWTARTLPASASWQSVVYGGSLFVAVATGGSIIAASSPDGITWTQRTLPASAVWTSVTYGGGVYATVASANTIAATSPDGITWTQRALSATSNSPMADVYKSPAAGNQFGSDWYLILRRAADFGNQLFYQVAEGYNATTHRASNYGGTAVSVVPVLSTGANPAISAAPETVCATSAFLTLTSGTPFTYWVSANANRVVFGAKTSLEAGFYAGLYDDLLPAGVTGFPLVCAQIPGVGTQAAATWAIGGGGSVTWGGFTREPGQSLATALNFEARIHSGWVVSASAALPGNFTPTTTTTALYGNVCSVSRVMLGSGRTAAAGPADALRGLLIGCVSSSVLSVIGDSISSGGKTYVRMTGPTTSYGIFADQAL